MEFPYEYFKAEMIGETLVSETMKKARASTLETLSEVINAIEKRNLHYCALYGTLLGAVRHGGFIPWDDDIDIGMPRKDYDIFRKTCFEDLPEGYNVLDPSEEYVPELDILRINNSVAPSADPDFLRKYHGCPFVIGIDIYPIDAVPDDAEMDQGICDAMRLIARVMTIDLNIESAGVLELGEREEILQILEKNLHTSFMNDETIHIDLMRSYDKLASAFKGKKTKNVTIYRNHFDKPSHIFPADSFKTLIDVQFENMAIKIPADYNKVLETTYSGYMKPVEWKNTVHHYGFEDQQRLVYDTLGFIL